MDPIISKTFIWEIPNFGSIGSDKPYGWPRNGKTKLQNGLVPHIELSFFKLNGADNADIFFGLSFPESDLSEMVVSICLSLLCDDQTERSLQVHNWHYDKQINSDTLVKLISRKVLLHQDNKLLSNGSVKIRCKISILKTMPPTDQVFEYMNLSSNLQTLLERESDADFSLACDGKEFKVHKTMLVSRSPVFAAMLSHDESKEAQEGLLVISGIEVEPFEQALFYIYTGKIPRELDRYAMELMEFADMYQLDSLKDICGLSLQKSISAENATLYLYKADLHQAMHLKAKAIKFIVKNSSKVVNTEGYAKLTESKRSDLLGELFKELVSFSEPKDEKTK